VTGQETGRGRTPAPASTPVFLPPRRIWRRQLV